MLTSEKFTYDIVLAAEQDGSRMDYEFASAWSPEKDFVTDESIGRSAAAQAYVEHGKRTKFFPVSVTRRQS